MKNIKKLLNLAAITIIALASESCGILGVDSDEVKLLPVKIGKEFQYINAEGKIIINPQFANATIFRNGLALVQTSGDKPLWGYINEEGKFAIIAKYLSATVFNEEMAWVVSENTAPSCIDTKGEVKFTLTNAEEVKNFSGGLAGFKEVNDEKWGFIDKEGKIKINAQFSDIGSFVNGLCPVSNNFGKWGYINQEGKLIVNYQFDFAESFLNGSAVVKSGDKAGLINEDGKFIINPQFSEMQTDGDLFLINQDGKYGWTDKEGKIVINPQFSRAFPFNNEKLAAVQSGENFGFINKEGKIIINPQFNMALPFNGKLALVVSSNKIGFIDHEGKYVINPQFDDVSSDLVNYLQNGATTYNSVKTDFFNIDAIIARVNIAAPEGLSFNSSMTEVLTKFKKSQEDFGKYDEYNTMISSEKITNDAILYFYISGNPWVIDEYNDNYSFNANIKPNAFQYVINLTGKGINKEDAVKSAIESSLKGYSKDLDISNENEVVYKNAKQSVRILTEGGNVFIIISSLAAIPNNIQERSMNYEMDSIMVDTAVDTEVCSQ